jgi:hypothetical protein
LLDGGVAVIDDQAPLGSRHRQSYSLAREASPDVVPRVLHVNRPVRLHLAYVAAAIDERQPGIRVD